VDAAAASGEMAWISSHIECKIVSDDLKSESQYA
jgi:hypothetical protein